MTKKTQITKQKISQIKTKAKQKITKIKGNKQKTCDKSNIQ